MEEVNEMNELQEQVRLLEDRIYVLERKDAARRARGWLRILIKILILIALIIGGFYAYNYVTSELPKIIENQIKETGTSTINKITDTIKGNN